MTTKERIDRHDKQIAVIRDLVKAGMQMVVATRKDLRSLAASQKRTEASLQALIGTLRRSGGHGHAKGKVDVH